MNNSFFTPIKLYDYTSGYGTQKKVKGSETNALCKVDDIGANITFQSMAAGVSLSCQVLMWRAEYNGQQYCEIGGVEYQINSSAKTFNSLVIKLFLSRG